MRRSALSVSVSAALALPAAVQAGDAGRPDGHVQLAGGSDIVRILPPEFAPQPTPPPTPPPPEKKSTPPPPPPPEKRVFARRLGLFLWQGQSQPRADRHGPD